MQNNPYLPNHMYYNLCITFSLLLTFLGSDDPYDWKGYFWGGILCVTMFTEGVLNVNQTWLVNLVGLRMKSMFGGLIYRKVS